MLNVAGLLALLAVLAFAATTRSGDADRLASWAAGFHACFLVPVLAGVAAWRGDAGFAAALPLLLLAQFLAIVVYGAFGLLCGLLTSRFVIVGLIYGAAIEVGLGSVPTQLGWLSLVRHLRGLLDPLLLRAGENAPGHLGAAATIALLLAAAAALLAVAAALFSRREFAGSAAREA